MGSHPKDGSFFLANDKPKLIRVASHLLSRWYPYMLQYCWYCWWFRNPAITTWDGPKTLYTSWDTLPTSTGLPDFFHQQYLTYFELFSLNSSPRLVHHPLRLPTIRHLKPWVQLQRLGVMAACRNSWVNKMATNMVSIFPIQFKEFRTFKGKYASCLYQIAIFCFHWPPRNPIQLLLLRNLDISETSIFAFAESLLESFGDEGFLGQVDGRSLGWQFCLDGGLTGWWGISVSWSISQKQSIGAFTSFL